MHVRVDHAGEGEAALAVVDLLRLPGGNVAGDPGELAALDGDVGAMDGVALRPHDAQVLEDEIPLFIFHRALPVLCIGAPWQRRARFSRRSGSDTSSRSAAGRCCSTSTGNFCTTARSTPLTSSASAA